MTVHLFVLIGLFVASFVIASCTALDTIGTNSSLRDGDTLISAGGDFELGFFSPTNSNTSRYVGIWFGKISTKTVIWVANRDAPLYDKGGTLNMTDQGILVLYNSTNSRVWSSNASATVRNPIAQLLNSGNLVVTNQEENSLVTWESFDYPCDSFIPGMKLGIDRVTGFQRFLSSWKTSEDSAPGEYSISVYENSNSYPQVILRKGTTIRYRAGSWNGLTFSGVDVQDTAPVKFIFNETEISFNYQKENSSIASRSTLNPSGMLQLLRWNERIQDWDILSVVQADQCEVYAFCGAFSICNVQNSPICGCLDGFVKNSTENQSLGCVRRTPLNCSEADGFIKYAGVKLPDTFSTRFNESIDLEECERLCLQNCSCTAYANLDIRGAGCLMWFDELIDIRVLNTQNQVLYLRVAASEIDAARGSTNKKKLVGIIVSLAVAVFSVLVLGLIIYRRRRFRRKHVHSPN